MRNKSAILKPTPSIFLALLSVFFGFAAEIGAQGIRPTGISLNSNGSGTANNGSQRADVSANGRYIVFESNATDLVAGLNDNNNTTDVFLRDTWTNRTSCPSVTAAGNTTGDFASVRPIVTPDGTYVIFASSAGNLVANDTNNAYDVFRVKVGTGEIAMVSRTPDNQNGGNAGSFLQYGEY